MAESRERYLDPHRDEIITLIRDKRYSQVRARVFLEQKTGLDIPRSTFSAYCQKIPELKEAPQSVSPEAEHFLEQYDVYTTITDGIKGITALTQQVQGRMGVLEDDAAKRHEALVAAIQQLFRELVDGIQERHEVSIKAIQQVVDRLQQHEAALTAIQARTQGLESPPDTRPAINAIQESLKRQAIDITAIRRSVGPIWSMVREHAPWMKAFTLTGLFWLAVIAGVMWYYQLWRFLPWKFWPLR